MKPTEWKAGVAKTSITPEEPMWLAGWAARRRPADGQAMELFVKALALEDSIGNRFVLLTADLIAIPRELATLVAAQVRSRWNLPRESILFNASHTHTGPELRPDKVPFFEIPSEFAARIQPFLLTLQEKMTASINSALGKLEPATLTATRSTVAFAHNRRSEDGPVAREVPILQITAADKRPLAVLFGYACHNLVLPPEFCQYHGDYAGIAQQTLEQAFPGVTAFFLAGAGADQDPAPRGTMELTQQHGVTLARAVEKALAEPGKAPTGPLNVAFEEVLLDFQPLPTPEALQADLASSDPPRVRKAKYLIDHMAAGRAFPAAYPCPVQVVRFGKELLLFAFGGEPVADYAVRLQAEFPNSLVWVAGYSNDMFGYLPSRRIQKEGGYEGGRALLWSALPAPFTDTVEERIMAAARRLTGGLDTAAGKS
jgi:hypothetical protein